MTISRDGLDHILNGLGGQNRWVSAGNVAKVRTASQKAADLLAPAAPGVLLMVADKTVFKAVGVAHTDLAVAEQLVERHNSL
jgi:hypothetical protein